MVIDPCAGELAQVKTLRPVLGAGRENQTLFCLTETFLAVHDVSPLHEHFRPTRLLQKCS